MVEIDAPGVHTVNIWMRESGAIIDKLVHSPDAGYMPSNDGADESPLEAGSQPPIEQSNDHRAPIAIEAEHYHT
jgi:hypothetical protein